MALESFSRLLFKNELYKFCGELLQISTINTIFTFYIVYFVTLSKHN